VYVDRRPPAAHNNSAKLLGLTAVTAVVVLMMGTMFWVLAANDNRGSLEQLAQEDEGQAAAVPADPSPDPTPAPAPAPAPPPEPVVVPAAPDQSELTSNDWLLARFALIKEGGNLSVSGTVQNLANNERSATLRVFVYANGAHIATGSGEVRRVPGGGTVEVSLPSGTPWSAGDVILFQAEDL
jgi:hypothetical protein